MMSLRTHQSELAVQYTKVMVLMQEGRRNFLSGDNKLGAEASKSPKGKTR